VSKKNSTNDRTRKVSIDVGAGIDLNKFFGRIYNVTNEECLYLASTLTMRGSK
jgi:hypothetical protein